MEDLPVSIWNEEDPRWNEEDPGKYVDSGWKQEAVTVRSQFGRGVLATRSILDLSGDVWAVPAALVGWLLNE